MLTFPSIVKLTVTGLRISAVDTVAFLDNCADLIPYAGSGRRIRIKDAAGKYLDGVIGARGTGETVGAEILPLVNYVTYPYDTFALDGTNITSGISDGSGPCVASVGLSSPSGKLFKFGADVTINSGRISFIGLSASVTSGDRVSMELNITASKNVSKYLTARSVDTVLVMSNENTIAGNFATASTTLKQVLTPSTSGLLIRNLAGAQSFQSQESGFTHNAASYVVEVFDMMRVARPIRYMGSSVHHK